MSSTTVCPCLAARLTKGGTTDEEAVARVFAREVERLYLRASGWPRRVLDTSPARAAPASWLTRRAGSSDSTGSPFLPLRR